MIGAMLTKADLQDAFRAYFDEIESCVYNRCYWALLHLIIIIPDICGALEPSNGEANSHRHKEWCKRYIADAVMSEVEWWGIRCILLHQGRTRARMEDTCHSASAKPTALAQLPIRKLRIAISTLTLGRWQRRCVTP